MTHGKGDQVRRLERTVGKVLQSGVLLSGSLLLLGWVKSSIDHSWFAAGSFSQAHFLEGSVSFPATFSDLKIEVLQGRSEALMVLGLVVLIGTPLLRVVFSLLLFLKLRDRIYAWLTATVLVLLMLSAWRGLG